MKRLSQSFFVSNTMPSKAITNDNNMMKGTEIKRRVINRDKLPADFPTHMHPASLWEALGRTVATFGFLEETLAKAIFAFTATRRISEGLLETEYEAWVSTLERTLTDPLGSLISSYEQAVRSNGDATITNFDKLILDLREVSVLRNAICHGSWRPPDDQGHSTLFYADKKRGVFNTSVDLQYLRQLRQCATELACVVIETVTHMGWQFPGSNGPGQPVY